MFIRVENIHNLRINPFVPSVLNIVRLTKISILIEEGIIKKVSYERRAYESVDEKSYLISYVPKNDKKKNPDTNGLILESSFTAEKLEFGLKKLHKMNCCRKIVTGKNNSIQSTYLG